ncbi:hypothetical protein PIB30_033302 [Stylosanthes scabra]|uniref:ADP-ribosyl cyclase/cyclic ADP-ribose hydrolase n=1 Tax=Stylosanthes scabra TaxID=79078 RepID=A0ABU6TEB8_9FABA|nr:hypothetical protein [Stylosanthes scabra]
MQNACYIGSQALLTILNPHWFLNLLTYGVRLLFHFNSTTTTKVRSSYSYHVFLSFRGEDTRNGFTSHLYAALNRKGITTYKDDNNLRKGDVISDELVKAIEESMFAIVVFSPDYASSSWCLDELCKIIECKNKLGLQMVEVFYGVEPCDVRHQTGTFREAFQKHERRHESEKIQRWRDALKQVAEYSGWSSKNQRKGGGFLCEELETGDRIEGLVKGVEVIIQFLLEEVSILLERIVINTVENILVSWEKKRRLQVLEA